MEKFDVIIAGGGTAGCAAAYIAGKAGLKTLLVEKNIHLGGAITSALVVPCMMANCPQSQLSHLSYKDKYELNTEFFDALVNEMKNLGGQVTYQGNKGWFNPELTKISLDNLMQQTNVNVLFSSYINSVNIESGNIKSCRILSEYNEKLQKVLSEPIYTRYVIDATGNCDVGKICGCNFLNDSYTLQPVSLRFTMANVDVNIFAEWILEFDKDRNVTTIEHIDGHIHFSTAYTWDEDKEWALKPFFEDAVGKGILKDTDRNYFQVFTVAGMPDTVAFNCPRIIKNVDYTTTLMEGRQAILRLSNFCKKYLKGFENAYISNIADELGIRVSNRIKGKYVYTIEDLKSGKQFEHPVLISNYPVDVHSANKDSSILEQNSYYELPVESLMSADINNLFVAGRCLSADYMAHGALRIQPNCFSMGEGLIKFLINN